MVSWAAARRSSRPFRPGPLIPLPALPRRFLFAAARSDQAQPLPTGTGFPLAAVEARSGPSLSAWSRPPREAWSIQGVKTGGFWAIRAGRCGGSSSRLPSMRLPSPVRGQSLDVIADRRVKAGMLRLVSEPPADPAQFANTARARLDYESRQDGVAIESGRLRTLQRRPVAGGVDRGSGPGMPGLD